MVRLAEGRRNAAARRANVPWIVSGSRFLSDSRSRHRLAFNEAQQVRVDHVGMSGHHAVREAGVDLEW
jgi:hypothetical protein